MTAFALTADSNIDSLASKAGGDTYDTAGFIINATKGCVDIAVAGALVTVSPANVTVQVPDRQEISIVAMPDRQTKAHVERDRDGNILNSTHMETDA